MVDIYIYIYICSIHGVYKPTFTSRLGGPHGYYFDGFETTSRLMGGFTAHTERWAMGKRDLWLVTGDSLPQKIPMKSSMATN